MPVMVDGELLPDNELRNLLHMLDHDCKEMAGQFFDNGRSAKFRAVWNDVGAQLKRSPQDCFVDHAWKHFMVFVRAWYAQRLTDPAEPEYMKVRMHKALVIQGMMSAVAANAETPVQMQPDTEQFEGDKSENKHTDENFGVRVGPGSLKNIMLRTASRRVH